MLAGQSAGAGSVLFHLVSPSSKGLFSSAVVESGGFYSQGQSDGQAYYRALQQALKCGSEACMRNKTAGEVLRAASGIYDSQPMPVVDGVLLPGPPEKLFQGGHINRVEGVIAGCNTNESTSFTVGSLAFQNINRTKFIELAGEMIPPGAPPEALGEVLRRYPPAATDNDSLYGTLVTDMYCMAPMRFVLAALAKVGTPVFNYRFNYNASFRAPCDLTSTAEYGVSHGAELPFVFGEPTYLSEPSKRCRFTIEDGNVAVQMGALWAAMAAGSTAAGSEFGDVWPQYDALNQSGLLVDRQMGQEKYRTSFTDLWLRILYPTNTTADLEH